MCSPDAPTQIKISSYVDVDTTTADSNGLNAGCIRLCYDPAAESSSENNAGTYCTTVPAEACVDGGNMYLLVDGHCAL